MTSWQWPSAAWTRIHVDFLGPFHGDMFLVVIDAHSKWPEIINMKNNTTACKLINVINELFNMYGLPTHLVSDNGRQLISDKLQIFLRNYKIKHTCSPPYHPATDGAAENIVRTFKKKFSK